MYTHSQLIDNLVAELVRPDLQAALSNYLNQTIRELHTTTDNPPTPVDYVGNLGEDQLTAVGDEGFSYDLENPYRFQRIESVYYVQFGRYATERKPSSIKAFDGSVDGAEYGYYRSGNQVFFNNYGGDGAQILIAWFDHIQRQAYYKVGQRPCQWIDANEDFTYYNVGGVDYNSTPELQAKARFLCTNWMIQRWYDTMLQGVRAKLWARLADDVRGKTAYSSYQTLRGALVQTETLVMAPRYRG